MLVEGVAAGQSSTMLTEFIGVEVIRVERIGPNEEEDVVESSRESWGNNNNRKKENDFRPKNSFTR